MSPARWLALLAGAAAIAWLVARLPPATFAATQAALLVAASAILLLVAAAMLLRPARALERALFGLAIRADGPLLGLPPEKETRAVLGPLAAAGVLVGVAAGAGLLR
jgi:hypothetical protein